MANFIEPILATRKRPRYGLTTVASRLPAGSDWRQGIDWRPEGCQAPDVNPICCVDPELLVISECGCDVWVYAPAGNLTGVDGGAVTFSNQSVAGIGGAITVINDNLLKIDFDCNGGFGGLVIIGITLLTNAGPVYGSPTPVPVNVTIDDNPDPCPNPDPPTQAAFDALLCVEKAAGNALPPVHFDPFLIYNPDNCNDGWTTGAENYARAKRELDMGFGALVARELLSSSVGNPDLQSSADDVSGGVAVNWTAGLAALLYNMNNAGYVGDIWIHAPTWLEPAFLASRAGQRDDDGLLWSGQHPAIFDAGYSGLIAPNNDPDLDVPPVADPGVTGWVYATGPVEWDQGPYLDDVADSADILTNSRYTLAERAGIVRFDPCHVFAVLIEATCAC